MGWVFGCTLAGLAAVLTVPAMQRLFQFAPIGATEVAAALVTKSPKTNAPTDTTPQRKPRVTTWLRMESMSV
jgi:hypothetical protein